MRWLLPLPFAFAGYSQGTNATLEGQVTDSSGGVIAGAVVKAVSSNTPSQWVSPSAFQCPDPVRLAGQFGNAVRCAVRGPGISSIDLSALKDSAVTERARLQFRAGCFNPANHANFGLPDNDVASPNSGRVLEAGAPRLMQFGIKLTY